MVIVLVGSKNPVKLEAVREAFSHYFEKIEVISRSVDSGVSDQPRDSDTFHGAKNRANALKQLNKVENLGAQFFVGLEGGMSNLYGKWFCNAVMCIMDQNTTGFGLTSHFELPKRIYHRILHEGAELGPLMDEITGEANTKQHDGASGYFTRNKVSRKDLYVPALMFALVPFLNEDLF
tara:strand:+ start:26896 stop:27429 length:534 start_codon:yes stop_codon:yes gene_type:complete